MKKFIFVLLFPIFCFAQEQVEMSLDEIIGNYDSAAYIYVIDGIPINIDSLKTLNQNEIENVYLLHDVPYICSGKSAIIIKTNRTETVYDLLVTEPGFDSFLAQQESQRTYSLEFLKSRNRMYVNHWNQKVLTGNPDIFDMRIDYDSKINYGLEIEYKLYQFFRFIEHKYKIRLI